MWTTVLEFNCFCGFIQGRVECERRGALEGSSSVNGLGSSLVESVSCCGCRKLSIPPASGSLSLLPCRVVPRRCWQCTLGLSSRRNPTPSRLLLCMNRLACGLLLLQQIVTGTLYSSGRAQGVGMRHSRGRYYLRESTVQHGTARGRTRKLAEAGLPTDTIYLFVCL